MRNFGQTRTSISRKIYCVKSGFQIFYAVEQFSLLFSKDKLKQWAHIHQTHDPPSPRMSWENRGAVPSQQLPHHLVWSWRLINCFALTTATVRGFPETRVSTFINPTALPPCWAPKRAKQLSVAATARVIWLCACVRYWLGRGLMYRCSLKVCTIFNAIELSSIYFSSITVFHDSSKQIQKRARIGKIFARWHLAMAITSNK